ncbi:hypothetical protein EOM60_00055 [Candidatus Saccharibacteria bacterium]|nr:hypothetical protein [Candidatus Saccharibacteria bacterium]
MPPKRVEQKLAKLTREFFAKHPDVKLIAVTGSTGKTSAKQAIATVLSQQYRLQLRDEEPQNKSEVFMQIMGVTMPESGWFKWRKVLKAVKLRVKAEHPDIQLIVQEFSPKDIGYNGWFREYLFPDITVVTSVTDGRMEVQHPIDEVANEMITLANNSKFAIINRDDVAGKFAGYLTNPNISTYGSSLVAEYSFESFDFSLEQGYTGAIVSPENNLGIAVKLRLLGEHNLRPATVAAAIGYRMGMKEDEIVAGVNSLKPLPGRMNLLRGADDSWLIDDSYSSTPLTAVSALQSLYAIETPQRIAVLGNMNGLKNTFEQAHAELGSYCTSDMLDWVVTVGEKANKFLAPSARKNGCQVKECATAIEAGAFVREKLTEGGIALFKGSSGGVWLEEAVKINLYSSSDEIQLVRQEPEWLTRKQDFFSQMAPSNTDQSEPPK